MNMAVFFWYLVKSDLSSVGYCTRVHWTSHFLQGTRNPRSCITCHPVPVEGGAVGDRRVPGPPHDQSKQERCSKNLKLISPRRAKLSRAVGDRGVPGPPHDQSKQRRVFKKYSFLRPSRPPSIFLYKGVGKSSECVKRGLPLHACAEV